MNLKSRSDILIWSIANISRVSLNQGVYVLRDSPSMEGIIYVGRSENLRRRLEEHFLSEDIPGVLFFDYYETYSMSDAESVERMWIQTYKPKYNDRVG